MRRYRGVVAAVGASMLLAGVLAVAVPAGAQDAQNGSEKPWPILQVMKTIGQADYPDKANEVKPPAGTTFYVTVTCETPVQEGGAAGASEPFTTTVLTFDSKGAPDTAAPNTDDLWKIADGYWTYTGKALKYKQCTAIETDVTDPEGVSIIDAPNLFQQYKCDEDATTIDNGTMTDGEAGAEGGDGLEFGCVTPEPFGEYVPDSTQASVQFTGFWDLGACGIMNWSDSDQVEAENGSYQYCQETGTLTVDNFDPAWNVLPEVVEFVPTFTG